MKIPLTKYGMPQVAIFPAIILGLMVCCPVVILSIFTDAQGAALKVWFSSCGGELIVLLVLGRKPRALVHDHLELLTRSSLPPGLWDWRDEFGAAALLDDSMSGLPLFIQLPVRSWVLVGIVQDRLLEESIIHAELLSSRTIFQLMSYLG